jgi:hypothetical protein
MIDAAAEIEIQVQFPHYNSPEVRTGRLGSSVVALGFAFFEELRFQKGNTVDTPIAFGLMTSQVIRQEHNFIKLTIFKLFIQFVEYSLLELLQFISIRC